MISILGIPLDENSSFLKGTAAAPEAIRSAFHSHAVNQCTENEVDLDGHPMWEDVGDVSFPVGCDRLEAISNRVGELLDRGRRLICLGGDHSVTFPILRSYANCFPNLNVLQLDAHPDLYDELDGNRYSHACPFARALEHGYISRLVQIGIRTMNPHQRAQADRFHVEVISAETFLAHPREVQFDGPVYLTLDLDVLDPAFAPGISHYEPGGLSTRDVLRVIQHMKGSLVGADIVELNPRRDLHGQTAMVGAKFLKELMERMLACLPPDISQQAPPQ